MSKKLEAQVLASLRQAVEIHEGTEPPRSTKSAPHAKPKRSQRKKKIEPDIPTDEFAEPFRSMFGQFLPLFLSSGKALADPRVGAYHAAYARNLFVALTVQQGFGEEQALRIVCAYGLGAGYSQSG
jgi:hypothetical protein